MEVASPMTGRVVAAQVFQRAIRSAGLTGGFILAAWLVMAGAATVVAFPSLLGVLGGFVAGLAANRLLSSPRVSEFLAGYDWKRKSPTAIAETVPRSHS